MLLMETPAGATRMKRLLLLATAALAALLLGVTAAAADDDSPCKVPDGFTGHVDADGNLPGVPGCYWKFDPKAGAWKALPYVDTPPPDYDMTGSDFVNDPFPLVRGGSY
jgi:hypothetical protein